MSSKHITIEERACIKKMRSEGSSIRAIALYLERYPLRWSFENILMTKLMITGHKNKSIIDRKWIDLN